MKLSLRNRLILSMLFAFALYAISSVFAKTNFSIYLALFGFCTILLVTSVKRILEIIKTL